MQISQIPISKNSLIVCALPVTHYSDCFCAQFNSELTLSLEDGIRYLFYNRPRWLRTLMEFRNILVKPLGLKTEAEANKKHIIPMINIYKGGRIAFFDVLECDEKEVLLYISDNHLDACLSIQLSNTFNLYEIHISTTVMLHNIGGRIYFFFIKPFHILIMRSMLHRLVKHFIHNKKPDNYENASHFV